MKHDQQEILFARLELYDANNKHVDCLNILVQVNENEHIKMSLKIPKWQSESVSRSRTDNTMTKRKMRILRSRKNLKKNRGTSNRSTLMRTSLEHVIMIFYHARQLLKTKQIENLWTTNGKIIMKEVNGTINETIHPKPSVLLQNNWRPHINFRITSKIIWLVLFTVLLQFLNKLIHVYIVINTTYCIYIFFPHPLTLIIKYCFIINITIIL